MILTLDNKVEHFPSIKNQINQIDIFERSKITLIHKLNVKDQINNYPNKFEPNIKKIMKIKKSGHEKFYFLTIYE